MKYFLPYQTLSTTGNGYSSYVFRGNSVFDPDYTTGLGSYTALQMSQMATDYTNYLVYGSKIKIKGTHVSGSAAATGRPVQLYLIPTPDDSGDQAPPSILSWETAELYPYKSRKTMFTNYVSSTTNADLSYCNFTMKKYMSSKKMIRDFQKADASGLLGATGTGTNPVLQWFWHIGVQNNDSQAGNMKWQTDITYYVLFFNRRPISGGELT